jgi:diguanylate cyclase (GGDEF)-like protein
MSSAPTPPTALTADLDRSAALKASSCLFLPADERFDRVTRIACRALAVPMSRISILERESEWFNSTHTLSVQSSKSWVSFCSWVVASKSPLVVADALEDARFKSNVLVLGDPKIRAYAGWPLELGPGLVAGTLCVIDHKSRQFSQDDLNCLRDIAKLLESNLKSASLSQIQASLQAEVSSVERRAMHDPVTGLWNKQGVIFVLDRMIQSSSKHQQPVAMFLVQFDGLTDINRRYGLAMGDAALSGWANMLRTTLPRDVEIGTLGGARFVVMLGGSDVQRINYFSALLKSLPQAVKLDVRGGEAQSPSKFGAAVLSHPDAASSETDIFKLMQLAENSLLSQ